MCDHLRKTAEEELATIVRLKQDCKDPGTFKMFNSLTFVDMFVSGCVNREVKDKVVNIVSEYLLWYALCCKEDRNTHVMCLIDALHKYTATTLDTDEKTYILMTTDPTRTDEEKDSSQRGNIPEWTKIMLSSTPTSPFEL
jgi:hypothetical protein